MRYMRCCCWTGYLLPILATGLNGVVVYNNPAFATMLGHHPDTVMLMGQQLPDLLAGRTATPAHDCVTTLRTAGNVVVDWLHVEGFPVHSVISETLFFRAAEQILLIGITDITELIWCTHPKRAETVGPRLDVFRRTLAVAPAGRGGRRASARWVPSRKGARMPHDLA